MRSRPGRDCTHHFLELGEVAAALASSRVVLDGELVVFGEDGRPDFGAIRQRLTLTGDAARSASARRPATFVAFDLLHLDGLATRALPYRARRELLVELAREAAAVHMAPAWTERYEDVVDVTRTHELEGVVYKRLDSTYRAGRRSAPWHKQEHRRRETLWVTAWAPGDREPDTFYVARLNAAGETVPAGGVQLGLNRGQREALRSALAERESGQRRRRIRSVSPGIELVVDAHGSRAGELRDAIIRDVVIAASS